MVRMSYSAGWRSRKRLAKVSRHAVCFLDAIAGRDTVQIVSYEAQTGQVAEQSLDFLHAREVAKVVLRYRPFVSRDCNGVRLTRNSKHLLKLQVRGCNQLG